MQRALCSLCAIFLALSLHADETAQPPQIQQETFKSFTGKIVRNKVRLRLQPNLDSKILREFNKGDLIIVTADSGEFYAVKPPVDLKGFVFRPFVLDNVVEGTRVNIRLEPDIEATVIGQLSKGTQIQGAISPLNSKWLEIALPGDVQFYISKEYVENIGDATMLGKLHQRLQEVNILLKEAQGMSQEELQKPFVQINLDPAYFRLNKIINQFADFPEQLAQARELLKVIQEGYLQRKITYLEERAKSGEAAATEKPPEAPLKPGITPRMAAWIPVEALLYETWIKQHPHATMDEFYAGQRQEAIVLTGVIEPYIRSLRNKPGDYLLISKSNQLPSAYLYSTQVDLQGKVGHDVTLIAVSRPNYNFAYPAYFVISVE